MQRRGNTTDTPLVGGAIIFVVLAGLILQGANFKSGTPTLGMIPETYKFSRSGCSYPFSNQYQCMSVIAFDLPSDRYKVYLFAIGSQIAVSVGGLLFVPGVIL